MENIKFLNYHTTNFKISKIMLHCKKNLSLGLFICYNRLTEDSNLSNVQCAPLLCFYFVILLCTLVTFSVIFEIEEISYRQNKLKFLTRFTNDTFHDVTLTLGVATLLYFLFNFNFPAF